MGDETRTDDHETKGTFFITGLLLVGFAAVWLVIYFDLLGR